MIKLITNNSFSSHYTLLEEILPSAEEVYISVAFLKSSGVNKLLTHFKKAKEVRILTGTNFGITDPEALSKILNIPKPLNITGYVNKLNSKVVFHPKMYLVRSGETAHIIIGSANLTNGGMEVNHECSVYYKGTVTDQLWVDSFSHFLSCISPENADQLSDTLISIYQKYHKAQKERNQLSETFIDVEHNVFYDLTKLKARLDELDKATFNKGIQEKTSYYNEARKVLDRIISKKHSSQEFKELVEDLVGKKDAPGLWYSNGMFRHKEKIFKQQSLFQELIRNIKNNRNRVPAFIYDQAKQITKNIDGVGPNFIGEIMMTYEPTKLANINRNPITVLIKDGDADIKNHSKYFNGEDYAKYNSIVNDISFRLGLKSMLEVDYFFNTIYQNLKKSH